MIGGKTAIVDAESGVTRDRHYGKSEWCGYGFTVVDTGGYIKGTGDIFEAAIREQVMMAIEESNAILFMVDVTSGITAPDEEIAHMLRKRDSKCLVIANKVDNNKRIHDASIFHGFGLGEVYCISSINGSGTGEMLDALIGNFNLKEAEESSEIPRFAAIGRPNVGKSSLVNALIGEKRNIVTEHAGTTRDAIDVRYRKYGLDFVLVDTAGLRKKEKVSENLEFYSVMRAIRAIESCDVCLLLIDATEGITAQDVNIVRLAEHRKKGVVLLVNKWDLIKKNTDSTKVYTQSIHEKLAPFKDVPVVFTSVINKERIFQALKKAIEVYNNRKQKIKTSELNEYLLEIIKRNPPPTIKGKQIKIKYVSQLPMHTPAFAFFCNLPQYVKAPYKRFLENLIREKYVLEGVPVKMYFRKK